MMSKVMTVGFLVPKNTECYWDVIIIIIIRFLQQSERRLGSRAVYD